MSGTKCPICEAPCQLLETMSFGNVPIMSCECIAPDHIVLTQISGQTVILPCPTPHPDTHCPTCNESLIPEHAHMRCPRCGYRDSCCF